MALTNSADNPRGTFGNGYAWSGHPVKDKATKWAQDIEEGTRSLSASGNGPSPLIWNNCPWGEYRDGVGGMAYFNDFTETVNLAANQSATHLGAGAVGFTGATAGTTITHATDEPTGSMVLSCTTDNETVGVSALCATNTVGNFVLTSGKKSWFEARIKGLTVGDDEFALFCGFAEEGLLAEDGLISDADALGDKDYIGFFRQAADGDTYDTVHRKNGGAAVIVKADAVTAEADTYDKIGFYCDGTTVTFYADGAALSDTALLATATVPTGEEMAFYFIMNNKGGADEVAQIDWVRIAREY